MEVRLLLPEKLRIDHDARQVGLSSILDWYDSDYLDWYRERNPGSDPTLLDYVRLYVPPDVQAELDRAADYERIFLDYDWSLNDQH